MKFFRFNNVRQIALTKSFSSVVVKMETCEKVPSANVLRKEFI
jgi:hypothetical protein